MSYFREEKFKDEIQSQRKARMEFINYWSPPLLQGEWRKAELQNTTRQNNKQNQWITKCVPVVLILGRLGQEVAGFKVRMGSMEILPQNGQRNPQAEQIILGSFHCQECWLGITWDMLLWMSEGLFQSALTEAVCTGNSGSTIP